MLSLFRARACVGSFGSLAHRGTAVRVFSSSGAPTLPSALVTPSWLHQHLEHPSIRVVDGSWYMPNDPQKGSVNFAKERIPRAVFFDLDAISDHTSNLPHMLPTPYEFAKAVGALGISDQDTIIVYDQKGIFSAPRVWWTFRCFGASRVAVLNGGLPAWRAAGYQLELGAPRPVKRALFQATLQRHLIQDLPRVRDNIEKKYFVVMDARGAGRFAGTEPEPRAGVRSGHIPGSINIPFTTLLQTQDGVTTYKPVSELSQLFTKAGVDITQKQDTQLVTSCGTGVTASVLSLGLYELGKQNVAVYDGAWTEWGSNPNTPVATGSK